MKISAVKTFLVNASRTNWVICKIETDDGLHGVGEGTVERRERAVEAAIQSIAPFLIGRDAFAVEPLVATINRDSYWRTGVINRSALSAIEAALLDIKGKALGLPVYELLGGKCRDRVPAYANNWARKAPDIATVVARARQATELGFRALKWDPFASAYMTLDRPQFQRALDEVAAVRDSVPACCDLMIEAHGRFNVPTAIRIGQALAEYQPVFLEEPVPPENLHAIRNVRNRIPVPVALGERYVDRSRFQEVLALEAADWLQPDVCHVGGLSELRKIAAAAEAAMLPVAPHNPMGPVGNAMTLQLAASVGNFAYLETMMVDVPWRADVVTESVTLIDGEMSIPDLPGLGIEFHEEAALAHPFAPEPPRHFVPGDPYPVGSRPWYRVDCSARDEAALAAGIDRA